MMQTHTDRHAAGSFPYLWITKPEVKTSKVGEKAEASEENPVLESRNKGEKRKE